MKTDGDIKESLLQAFNNDPNLGGNILYAGIHNGVVTLLGEVRNELEKAIAERIVMETKGVAAVNNHLRILGVMPDADTEAAYAG
jgi:osmotically-inducible protein OsmY